MKQLIIPNRLSLSPALRVHSSSIPGIGPPTTPHCSAAVGEFYSELDASASQEDPGVRSEFMLCHGLSCKHSTPDVTLRDDGPLLQFTVRREGGLVHAHFRGASQRSCQRQARSGPRLQAMPCRRFARGGDRSRALLDERCIYVQDRRCGRLHCVGRWLEQGFPEMGITSPVDGMNQGWPFIWSPFASGPRLAIQL